MVRIAPPCTKTVEKFCDQTSLKFPLKIFHVLGVTIKLLTYRANVSRSVSPGTTWQALPYTRFQLSKYISLYQKTCLFKYSQIFKTLRFGLPFCTGNCKGMLDRNYQYIKLHISLKICWQLPKLWVDVNRNHRLTDWQVSHIAQCFFVLAKLCLAVWWLSFTHQKRSTRRGEPRNPSCIFPPWAKDRIETPERLPEASYL